MLSSIISKICIDINILFGKNPFSSTGHGGWSYFNHLFFNILFIFC